MTTATVFAAIGFLAGMTLYEIGGRGVRWPARPNATAWPAADTGPFNRSDLIFTKEMLLAEPLERTPLRNE